MSSKSRLMTMLANRIYDPDAEAQMDEDDLRLLRMCLEQFKHEEKCDSCGGMPIDFKVCNSCYRKGSFQ